MVSPPNPRIFIESIFMEDEGHIGEERSLVASLIRRGGEGNKIEDSFSKGCWEDFFFLNLLIVTFSKRIKSRGRVDGDKGVLSVKMERVSFTANQLRVLAR